MKEKSKNRSGKPRRLLSLLLTAALALTPISAAIPERAAEKAEAADVTLKNPRIVADDSMAAGQKVTWDCVWFGSYPQAEVIPGGVKYTALVGSLRRDGDVIISDSVYAALQSASGWDANNDITLNGARYRRMKKEDATYSSRNSSHYQWGSSTDYHYFKYEPIKWRVLRTDGNQVMLLSDIALDDQKYHTEYESSVTWEISTMRSWLNGYGAESNQQSVNYSQKNFINSAFNTQEQEAIINSSLENADNITQGTEGGNDTNDKIFLISESEIWNTDQAKEQGFVKDGDIYDEARRCQSSAYAKAMGISSYTDTPYVGNAGWWLRSPGYNEYEAVSVNSDGWVGRRGSNVINNGLGVRPALNLNLSSPDIYTYAGSVCSDGTDTEVGGETPEPSSGNLQCSSSCIIEAGQDDSVTISAVAEDYESLRKLTESVTWASEDTAVVTVKNAKFVLPTVPATYETENGSYERWIATGKLRVHGVSEGSTTINGSASDGSYVTCKVTVSAPPDAGGSGGTGGKLVLGEEKSGSADKNSGVSAFFPDTWSLKSTVFPVEISVSEDPKNGSHKLKAAIGVGKSDWLNDDAKWNKFKKNVSDAKKYSGRLDCLEGFRETWGVKSLTAVSTDKFKALPQLSVMGYVENTYDKNWNLISKTGKLAADAKWSGSVSWQFLTPIGPLYLNLSGGGKLSGELGPVYDYQKKEVKIADGSLKITPSVTLEGGYGVDKVATIGAQGTLSLPVTLVPATKGGFSAKASVHVKLVFVVDYTQDLATYKKTLWDTTGKNKRNTAGQSGIALSEGTLSEMDTSFAEKTSAWNGGNSGKRARAVQRSTTQETVLQEGILESSLPMQAEINGKRVMVFQSYEGSRTILNSSLLKYSVYENGVWSEPEAVWDNGCADLYADMKVVDGQLVCVWQKEKAEIGGDVGSDSGGVLKNFARNSEICFALFDEQSGTFQNPSYVTDNDACDMMPRICENSRDIILSWVRNDEADLMQGSGKNTIYTVKWNGNSFEPETALVQSPGTVNDYVVYQDAEGTQTVFNGTSGDLSAVFDREGQVVEGLTDLIMFSDEGKVSSLHYADGKIAVVSGGTLYSYDPLTKEAESALAGDSAFGSEVQYCSNGEKSGCIWSIYDEETGMGSIQASMKTEEGYSEPVVLYEKQGMIWRYLSPVLDSDGNWKIVANGQNVEEGLNALAAIDKTEENAVMLVGASIDENDVKDGLTGVDYFVVNTGDTPVESMDMEITLGDGKKITKAVPVTILPGESASGTAYADLSGIQKAQEVEISVAAENQADRTGCTVKAHAGLADISVTGRAEEGNDQVVITAALSNGSLVDGKTTLHLYSDETQKKELGKSGELTIHAKGNSTFRFTVPKKDIIYNEKGAAYLTLYAETSEGDYNSDNNVAYVILYKDTVQNPSVKKEPAVRKGQTVKIGRLKYKVSKVNADGTGEAALTGSVTKKLTALNIPDTIRIQGKSFKVTSVEKKAFQNCRKLKKAVFGKYVSAVRAQAFMGCRSLKSVQIKGKALRNISAGAFKKTSAKMTVSAKKLSKKQKAGLMKKFRKAGMSKKAKMR